MRQIILSIVSAGLLLLVLMGMTGREELIWSAQVGYWSSVLVVAASLRSYRAMVRRRLELGMVPDLQERDVIEKMEDPYDLYSGEPDEESRERPLKEVVAEEKRRMKQKRRSPIQTMKDSAPAFSPLRLGAYLLLLAGFFYLRDRECLYLPAYLGALALPIVLTVRGLLRGYGGDDVAEA